MHFKTALVFAGAVLMATGAVRAADVPDATQKALADIYQLSCTAALDPSDKNMDAAFATLAPDFVNVDTKGKEHKRDEVVAQGKQQMKLYHSTTCDNKFETITASDDKTIVIVNTLHVAGDVQTPDGKHDFNVTNKAQDTWKLVDGKWLESQSKDLHVLVKLDGNVVQDAGSGS